MTIIQSVADADTESSLHAHLVNDPNKDLRIAPTGAVGP